MRRTSCLVLGGFWLAALAAGGLEILFAQQGGSPPSTLLKLELRGRVATVHDDWNYLEEGIQAGDSFTVRMAFDVRGKLVAQSETMARYVQGPSSATGISMEVRGRLFVTDQAVPWHIEVRNENPPDRFLARADVKVPVDLQGVPWDMHTLVVSMTDDRGEQLDDTRLPATLSLDGWRRASCVLSFVRSSRFSPIRFHPGASVVVSGIVEEIKILDTSIPFRCEGKRVLSKITNY